MPRETDTTLMLSESSFTTHASSLFRGFTDTGSRPTGISAMRMGFEGLEVSNTESRASGVFTANSRVPSGESRTGAVCLPSKLTKVASVGAAHSVWANEQAVPKSNERTRVFIGISVEHFDEAFQGRVRSHYCLQDVFLGKVAGIFEILFRC